MALAIFTIIMSRKDFLVRTIGPRGWAGKGFTARLTAAWRRKLAPASPSGRSSGKRRQRHNACGPRPPAVLGSLGRQLRAFRLSHGSPMRRAGFHLRSINPFYRPFPARPGAGRKCRLPPSVHRAIARNGRPRHGPLTQRCWLTLCAGCAVFAAPQLHRIQGLGAPHDRSQ